MPLVWAKLKPPIPAEGTVTRERVLQALTDPAEAALTVIVAPAGYGKTTAAVQLTERLGIATAWVSLEAADGDPVRFWTYVAAALQSAGVSGAEAVRELLSAGPEAVAGALGVLRSSIETFGDRVALVLDDMQVLDETPIPGQVTELLRNPLANLQIVCASRTALPLPVGRLRSHGRLSEVRIHDLAFSAPEVADVLDQTFGLSGLTTKNTSDLFERTEGWPVGVHLAALGLKQEDDVDAYVRRFAGDRRHLSEYLAAEALDDLPSDVRAFMLATSIVNLLVPDLCDELTGPGSLGTLRRLVRENVFTSPLDGETTMFRYHPLFREHLQSQLREELPEAMAELHDRASKWFERNGDIDQAITHAVQSADFERAQDLIERSWPMFARAGQFVRLERWIDMLTEHTVPQTRICLMMNWVLLNSRRYEEISAWEQRARDAAATAEDRWLCDIETPLIYAHVLRHQGHVRESREQVEAALELADLERQPVPGQPTDRAIAITGSVLTAAGVAQYWDHDHEVARGTLMSGVAHARASGELSSVIMGYSYLALLEADLGNSDLAMAHADQGLALVDEENERFHLPAAAHLARSRAAFQIGRVAEAVDALAEVDRIAEMSDEPLLEAAAELHRARVLHVLADRAGSRSALRSARAIVEGLPDSKLEPLLREVENETRFGSSASTPGGDLTDRERAVLNLLPHGLARRELAEQLHVSENTVKTHLTSIRHKLGVQGRESIVDRAVELGLLELL